MKELLSQDKKMCANPYTKCDSKAFILDDSGSGPCFQFGFRLLRKLEKLCNSNFILPLTVHCRFPEEQSQVLYTTHHFVLS